jgi:LysR family transcriptional regulator, nitrogen assimilation regulatory protein
MLTLSQCRLINELVGHGSLNRAATVMGSSTPAMSRKLAAIEQAAGAPLFHRTGRGLALSEFGERILPNVQRLLDEAAELEAALDDSGSVRGTVRIGLLPQGFDEMLTRLLRLVEARHPGIRLLISDGSSGALEEALNAGRLDLAFIVRVNPSSGENLRLLGQNLIEIYIPENFQFDGGETLSLRDIAHLPLIVPQAPNSLRTALQKASADLGLRLNIRYEINSFGFQMQLLHKGFGCYVGARGTVQQRNLEGDLRIKAATIVDPSLAVGIALAHSSHHPLTRASHKVMDLAMRIARELRGSSVWRTNH